MGDTRGTAGAPELALRSVLAVRVFVTVTLFQELLGPFVGPRLALKGLFEGIERVERHELSLCARVGICGPTRHPYGSPTLLAGALLAGSRPAATRAWLGH
jgi:hypothetical protein